MGMVLGSKKCISACDPAANPPAYKEPDRLSVKDNAEISSSQNGKQTSQDHANDQSGKLVLSLYLCSFPPSRPPSSLSLLYPSSPSSLPLSLLSLSSPSPSRWRNIQYLVPVHV